MTVEELIVMLREYSERGSEEDFAEAAGFLEAFQYENKEYRKQMTTQVARIEELEGTIRQIVFDAIQLARAALEEEHD